MKPPKLWIRTKNAHKYYMASWRKDGKTKNVHIGLISMDREEANQKALELRVADLTGGRIDFSDIDFAHEDGNFQEVAAFIERHEFLEKMSLYPSDVFSARYRGLLAGVVTIDPPLAFSKLLGDDTKDLERLISRGASAAWSPKNLGSWLIARAIHWMTRNTQYRVFVAYADTQARANGNGMQAEVGVIYQACGFAYLGQTFGTDYQYRIAPDRWVSDRYFRSRSVYK